MTDNPKACQGCGQDGTAAALPPGGKIRKLRLYKLGGRWLCANCGDRAIEEWNAIVGKSE